MAWSNSGATSQTLHYRVADPRALRLLQVLKEIYCGDLK